jgi:hypothetical protein
MCKRAERKLMRIYFLAENDTDENDLKSKKGTGMRIRYLAERYK